MVQFITKHSELWKQTIRTSLEKKGCKVLIKAKRFQPPHFTHSDGVSVFPGAAGLGVIYLLFFGKCSQQ